MLFLDLGAIHECRAWFLLLVQRFMKADSLLNSTEKKMETISIRGFTKGLQQLPKLPYGTWSQKNIKLEGEAEFGGCPRDYQAKGSEPSFYPGATPSPRESTGGMDHWWGQRKTHLLSKMVLSNREVQRKINIHQDFQSHCLYGHHHTSGRKIQMKQDPKDNLGFLPTTDSGP